MAATSIGLSSVAFGLASETGVVIQSFSLTQTAETTEVSKHNGEHSAVAFSAFKRNVSLSGNCSGAVASSGIGQTLALTGNTTAVSSCSGSGLTSATCKSPYYVSCVYNGCSGSGGYGCSWNGSLCSDGGCENCTQSCPTH